LATKKIKIPFDSLKIGYYDVKITPTSHDLAERLEIFGEFNSKNQEITYDEDLQEQELMNTILHETIHAISFIFNIQFSKDAEEEVTVKLANGLQTVFRDNPEFLNWIINKI